MPDTETIRFADGVLDLLDQTRLPGELTRLHCHTVEDAHDAILRLVVRGAPAIGISAAYGVCLAGRDATRDDFLLAADHLATSRPTAVNLFWALDRIRGVIAGHSDDETLYQRLVEESQLIHDEDRQMCRNIGRNGAGQLADCKTVLTHCNAGGLATSMWGTALAPIYHLHENGTTLRVFADETRPLLQGSRLTAWELSQAGIPVTVLTDSMAGSLLRTGQVDAVIVGADRITAGGDVANKIGTYPLAVMANRHNVPFYVAAPTNTFDMSIVDGNDIPIEQRGRDEVVNPHGHPIAPEGVDVYNPAFDVTPAELVTAIITEKSVIERPNVDRVAAGVS